MNKMITQAYRVGQTARRVAGYVGQGMKWTENIVDKTTGGVMRFGGYFSSLGSDVLLFRDGGFSTVGWTALAVPLKTVGWGIILFIQILLTKYLVNRVLPLVFQVATQPRPPLGTRLPRRLNNRSSRRHNETGKQVLFHHRLSWLGRLRCNRR